MGNLFDRKQSILHNTINKTFGYMVSWAPENGDPTLVAKCLFQDPTKAYKLGEVEYSPNFFSIEYRYTDLPGLYKSVRKGNRERLLIYNIGSDISTAKTYVTMKPGAIWDGKTYYLVIEESQS